MEIWRKNLKALSYKNKKLADKLEEMILLDNIQKVQSEEISGGEKILTVRKEDYMWRLNSRLDPEGASNLYADRYSAKPFYRYFIFGFSDGRIVKKLLEKCDESNVLIICEPEKEILAQALCQYDFWELFSDRRVWICVFDMREDICQAIVKNIDYSYIKSLEFCILPNYDLLYAEKCKKFIDEVCDQVREEIICRRTWEFFDKDLPRNKLFHMKHMVSQRNVSQIRNELKKTGTEGIPAIIIAAGPSLDKNIKEVKKAEGKAFILVADAALRTVAREGIRPDLVCTIDARAPKRFYGPAEKEKFLWFSSVYTSSEIARKYMEKVFYYNLIGSWWNPAVKKELAENFSSVQTGGSVTEVAFQLACYLGFQTIIFVGQDLAFTGGRSHTDGVKGILGDNDEYINGRFLVQVEGIHGEILTTDFQMDYYRQCFEKQIENYGKNLRVIDATEGGARIKGTAIFPLKEAIERECRREINIHEILDAIQPVFNEKEQALLYGRMKELEEIKENFKKEVNKQISLTEKLQKEAGALSINALTKKSAEIASQSEKLDKHPFMEWITMYARKTEYELQEKIYAEEDLSIEEILERNIRLLSSYLTSIPLFEEDFQAVFSE